jgi:autotransporter-associated beta strand protein
LAALAIGQCVFIAAHAFATDRIWTGAFDTTWNSNSNWTTAHPGTTDNAVFNSAFTNQPNLTSSTSAGGIWMTGSVGQNVTISGSALTLNGNSINGTAGLGVLIDNANAYRLTITAQIKLNSAQTWTNNSGNLFTLESGGLNTNNKPLTVGGSGDTTISGVITSAGAITKSGTGILTLSATNTWSGATTVTAGKLKLSGSSGSALGSTSGITVNSGGTLALGGSNQISNSATMTLAGGTFAKGEFSEGTASSTGVGALTLTANAHIDFGTENVGTLTFASLTAGIFTLTIDHWTGSVNTVGNASTDRLVFDSDQTANLPRFDFTGYSSAVEFALGSGFYEVVPLVPEPATWLAGIMALAAVFYQYLRRIYCAAKPDASNGD